MKIARTLMTALAALILAGTVASATTFQATEETPGVSESPPPEATDPPAEEPPESLLPDPGEDPDAGEGDDATVAPDFSACEGFTGLENAICRHEALLDARPVHPGLLNALDHLLASLERRAAREGTDPPAEDPPTEGASDATSCPGKSCEAHGSGNANGRADP